MYSKFECYIVFMMKWMMFLGKNRHGSLYDALLDFRRSKNKLKIENMRGGLRRWF